MPETITIPGAIVNWTGEFQYTAGKGWEAYFKVHFTETGNPHDVTATERGFVDCDGKYIWILTDVQVTDNPEEKELTLYGEWNQFLVKEINPLTGEAKIYNARDDKIYTLHKGEEVEIRQFDITERTTLELKDLTWSSVRLVLHHYTVASGTVEVYPNPGYPPGTELEEGMTPTLTTNSTPQPFIDPTKVPAVMIVVGEHAAGADVAAGAKVGIAVQKWIDLVKEKGGDALIPELGGGFTAKLATFPVERLNADAMLDTEVTDPENLALVVYSVGGPAANQYSAMLNNRTDLPVRFVKENGKWYLVSKTGERWSGSYGVIMLIPASRDAYELKMNLMNGKFKIMDVLVAGLDRWGTYAACELLQGEFLKPVKGMKPDADLMTVITLQTQVLTMFVDPFSIFEVGPDPTKVPITAIIVDKNGRIVKVIVG